MEMEPETEFSESEAVSMSMSRQPFFSISGMVTPTKLFRGFFNVRSQAILLWTVIAIYIMNLFNAFVYSRLPTDGPLPDIIADSYRNYGVLRGSASYMQHQPADMLSVFLTVSSILSLILFWDKANVKKLGVVYCLCLHVRTFFFTVTGLPPTCIGYPNTDCKDR